jgi:hypothetical protein
VEQPRVLLGAGRFVGGDLRKAGDALGLLAVGLGQLADLGLEGGQQLQQLAAAVFFDGLGTLDAGFNLSDGILNHGSGRFSVSA